MRSFISYPETSEFPIENLPYGVFSTDIDVSLPQHLNINFFGDFTVFFYFLNCL